MDQTAVVFGATGLVGYDLVCELLDNNDYDKVIVVTRRRLVLTNPKLEQLILQDFAEVVQHKEILQASVYFCCIGTTIKKAGRKEAFRKVDYDIPFLIARLAEDLQIPTLVVISSMGAATRTSNFYLRTKGEMEMAVRETFTGKLVFIHPSLLLGYRNDYRFGESIAIMLMRIFGWLFVGKLARYRGIEALDVAKAMMVIARLPSPDQVYESDELRYLSKGILNFPKKKSLSATRRVNLGLLIAFIVVIATAAFFGHQQRLRDLRYYGDLPEIQARGELRALTLYSSTSYFIFRDREMGYEYELCSRLAESLGLTLKMIPVPNILALKDSLDAGVGDIIAYNVPVTLNIREQYLTCGRDFRTHQVLVQQKNNPELVKDVTQLIGKEIVVQKGTMFHTRLLHLNNELGGGILIRALDKDSIDTEEMIGKVASGQLSYTIADNVMAQFNKTYYKNLHISTSISFPQESFWIVRKEAPLLAKAVNDWFLKNVSSSEYRAINKRYFERSKGPSPFLTTGRFIGRDGRVSPFDALFKTYARAYGLDWRLLASVAYQESKFDASAVSWAGAVGLMQLMPKTASDYEVNPDSLFDPEKNILAAVRLIRNLERQLRSVESREHRLKLVLAGFNSGLGHVLDARALARKYGRNPDNWDDVCNYILLKRHQAYYDDPVCKQGYLRGSETANFVTEVWARYEYYISKGLKK